MDYEVVERSVRFRDNGLGGGERNLGSGKKKAIQLCEKPRFSNQRIHKRSNFQGQNGQETGKVIWT